MSSISIQKSSAVQWRLVINFVVLSIAAACMSGMGKRSSNLPLLVMAAAALALVNSEWLGWLRINRTLSYIAMLVGTAIALYEFWHDRPSSGHPGSYSGTANLHAVANMLVYIQLPLMFQRRDARLFEHWGVFLLLEFVVAALLNDNVLFGIFLVPALILGCATLLALAIYLTYEQSDVSSPETSRNWSQLWNSFLWNRRHSSKSTGIIMSSATATSDVLRDRTNLGWIWGLLVSVGVFHFAIVYFFCLPRLHAGAFEGLGFNKPLVGFSGRISLRDIGELMTSDDIALRMSIQDSHSKSAYKPQESPYIRGTIVDKYDGRGNWISTDLGRNVRDILLPNELRDELHAADSTYLVSITEHAYFDKPQFTIPPSNLGKPQFSMPPFFHGNNTSRLQFSPKTWCLSDNSSSTKKFQPKQRYQFETAAYPLSRQIPYLIDVEDCLQPKAGETEYVGPFLPKTWLEDNYPDRFQGLLELRDQILSQTTSSTSLMEKVLLLEDYLSNSKSFTYSLRPKINLANGKDPIEDFAANHRTGHCQYFASTLTIMLRSLGLPSRIVIGFRPGEYNEIGGYFIVRQRHAHAWVEVHLKIEDLQDNSLDVPVPSGVKGGIWLRLDPTPAGEGSNAGGSLQSVSRTGQTYEAMEQLWKDNFLELDNTRQPPIMGLFGSSGDGAIGVIFRSVERLMLQLQSRAIGGETLSTENNFSWVGGLAASLLAVIVIFALRLARQYRWRFEHPISRKWLGQKMRRTPSWSLFQRLTKALGQMGLHRQPHQTPLEFVQASQIWLDQQQFVAAAGPSSLEKLVDAFYAFRFGSEVELSPEDLKSLDASVRSLEVFSAGKRVRFSVNLYRRLLQRNIQR